MATIHEERVDAAAAPAGEYDVGAAFDEHAIEWWVYDGTQLVPAAPEQAALLTRMHDGGPHRAHQRQRPRQPFAGRLVALAARILRKS